MKQVVVRVSRISLVVLAVFGFILRAAAEDLPLYRASYTYALTNGHLRAFNNAGDILVFGDSRTTYNVTTSYLLRKGAMVDLLFQPSTNTVQTVLATDITETNGSGAVSVTGKIVQPGVYDRAFVINVNNAGQITSTTLLPFYVEPENSAYAGQTNLVTPAAINSSGEVVGPRGLGGIVRWFPPYTDTPSDSFFGYGLAAVPIGLDEQGRVLTAAGFDPGGPLERASAALDSSGTLTEVPYLYYDNSRQLTTGNAIQGGHVVGYAYVPDYDSKNPNRAFVWKIGDAASTRLPDPVIPGWTVRRSEPTSVNTNGDAVGWVNLYNGYNYAANYPVVWKRSGNGYTPYLLYQLLPERNELINSISAPDYGSGGYFNFSIFINDAGQIAYTYQPVSYGDYVPDQFVLLDPLTTGYISSPYNSFGAVEEDGSATLTVNLVRSLGYSNAVSVAFTTSNHTAVAGVDFIATNGVINWAAGESGPKDIKISLINDVVYRDYRDFYVKLASPTGAELSTNNAVLAYVTEGNQTVQFVTPPQSDITSQYFVARGFNKVVLTLQRTGPGDGAMSVSNLYTYDQSAQAGIDYVGSTQTVSWAAGESGNKTVTVNLLNSGPSGSTRSFGLTGTAYLDSPGGTITLNYPYVTVSILPTNQLDHPLLSASSLSLQGTNFGFDFSGDLGTVFVLEQSTNLTNWVEVQTFTNTNVFQHFTVPRTNSLGGHYYRTKYK